MTLCSFVDRHEFSEQLSISIFMVEREVREEAT
jgi:hypothetical protein